MDMSMHWCSAVSRTKPRKRGTNFGTIAGCALGVAAAAAGSPREGADLHGSDFFCRPTRRNGGARGDAAPRRAAAPTLFASRVGARVADTRISKHAARAAPLRCQFFYAGCRRGQGRRLARRLGRRAAVPGGGGRPRDHTEPLRGRRSRCSRENVRDSFFRTAGAPPGGRPPRRARPTRRPKLRGRSVDGAANKSGAREFRTWDKVKR